MKKKLCLMLAICTVVLSCFSTRLIFADNTEIDSGIIFTFNSRTKELSQSRKEEFSAYGLTDDIDELDVVNAVIEATGGEETAYDCPQFEKLLKKFLKIREIYYSDDDNVYIQYYTDDGKEVTLWYGKDGIKQKLVYDINEDWIYIEEKDTAYITTHFREGYHFEISDELLDKIYKLLDEGKLDEIKLIKGINVITDDDGSVVIEPDFDVLLESLNNQLTISSSSVPQSDTQLLSHLKSKFPMYTNKVKSNTQLTCSALNRSVAVKVTETRNTYTKVSANWVNFVVSTALTVIGNALDVNVAAVKIILDVLGVGYSAADTLQESVRLSSSANYSYKATKRGCVNDPTVVHGYVLVIRYANTQGRFSGGYLNTGEFNWVHQPSSVYSYSDTSVRNTALTNYNNDLVLNNNLCTYKSEYAQWSD